MTEDRNSPESETHKNGANSDRGPGGRFKKGQGGRKKGSRNRATMLAEKLIGDDIGRLIEKAKEMAHDGNATMMSVLLRSIIPAKKERPAPLQFKLPALVTAADAVEAIAAITDGVARGLLDADEARVLTDEFGDPSTLRTLTWDELTTMEDVLRRQEAGEPGAEDDAVRLMHDFRRRVIARRSLPFSVTECIVSRWQPGSGENWSIEAEVDFVRREMIADLKNHGFPSADLSALAIDDLGVLGALRCGAWGATLGFELRSWSVSREKAEPVVAKVLVRGAPLRLDDLLAWPVARAADERGAPLAGCSRPSSVADAH